MRSFRALSIIVVIFLLETLAPHALAANTCSSVFAGGRFETFPGISKSDNVSIAQYIQHDKSLTIREDFSTEIFLQKNSVGEIVKTKKVVLLVHGLLNNPKWMSDIADAAFKEGVNVMNYRMPGHFEKDRTSLDRVQYREWLNGLREAYTKALLVGDEVVLVGHSVGGLISAVVASENSQRNLGGLVLIAPAFKDNLSIDLQATTLSKLGISNSIFPKEVKADDRYISTFAGVQTAKLQAALAMGPIQVDGIRFKTALEFAFFKMKEIPIQWLDVSNDKTISDSFNEKLVEALGPEYQIQYDKLPKHSVAHRDMTNAKKMGAMFKDKVIQPLLELLH